MAATAPFCNVTVFTPAAQPVTPHGFKLIPAKATLEQVINIVNQNLSPITQVKVFNQLVLNDINNTYNGPPGRTGQTGRTGQAGQAGRPGQTGSAGRTGRAGKPVDPSVIRRTVQQELGKVDFKQAAIVRKKVKVYNPNDKEQYVIDDRVVSLSFRDKSGAKWTFRDPNAEKA